MVKVNKLGVILSETQNDFENDGVLNPAIIQENKTVHILYRAVQKGNKSTIGYAILEGPTQVVNRNTNPLIDSELQFESQGVEDPRIVKMDEIYYITYCGYDGQNALGALITSTNLKDFEKQGVIVPQVTIKEFKEITASNKQLQKRYLKYVDENENSEAVGAQKLLWDKNVILFPRKIKGKFTMFHRIKPDIQILSFNNFTDLTSDFWKKYLQNLQENTVLTPKFQHEINYIGGGCPPIETPEGWLVIYHGVETTDDGNIYSACAALLDLENPSKEKARLPYPLIKPETEWEQSGYVNNVIFPTGTAIFEEMLYIYYGAADKRIAVATVPLQELITELLKFVTKK